MTLTVEIEREEDGRWIAEIVELPGVLVYGQASDEAVHRAQAVALRVLVQRQPDLFGRLGTSAEH